MLREDTGSRDQTLGSGRVGAWSMRGACKEHVRSSRDQRLGFWACGCMQHAKMPMNSFQQGDTIACLHVPGVCGRSSRRLAACVSCRVVRASGLEHFLGPDDSKISELCTKMPRTMVKLVELYPPLQGSVARLSWRSAQGWAAAQVKSHHRGSQTLRGVRRKLTLRSNRRIWLLWS